MNESPTKSSYSSQSEDHVTPSLARVAESSDGTTVPNFFDLQRVFIGGEEAVADSRVFGQRVSPRYIYPHVFDESADSGGAIQLLTQSLVDSRAALAALDTPDMNEVFTRLRQIAATASSAQPFTGFNDNFGSIVGFVRRACLLADPERVDRAALNALVAVLGEITQNPMLSLGRAGELVDSLMETGWQGFLVDTEELLALLLEEEECEATSTGIISESV